jgi:hypothetical protein
MFLKDAPEELWRLCVAKYNVGDWVYDLPSGQYATIVDRVRDEELDEMYLHPEEVINGGSFI